MISYTLYECTTGWTYRSWTMNPTFNGTHHAISLHLTVEAVWTAVRLLVTGQEAVIDASELVFRLHGRIERHDPYLRAALTAACRTVTGGSP